MRLFSLGFALAVFCHTADAAFVTYNIAGITTGTSSSAVSASISFDTNTPVSSSNSTTANYAPTPAMPFSASILVGGTVHNYSSATPNSLNDSLEVRHDPGSGDAFDFFVVPDQNDGVDLAFNNTTGTALPNTSLSNQFNYSQFTNFSLVVIAGGQSYNVAVTSFALAVPEPSSLLMTSLAGALIFGIKRVKWTNQKSR